MPELYSLYEFASGYALLHVAEWEQIGQDSEAVQEAVQDFSRLSSVCKLKVRLRSWIVFAYSLSL